ncbi:MAG: ABC transporter ATP-binding protein [Deferribacteraceae bacterium]|jgi:phospholipid/cholesterol/gamma-HCH transport system ATP-binding protein|nr:ABC transporter ATP-binding protein [Deferribacteraceae bacterium]
MIKFIHTTKKFGDNVVHKDIDLHIERGKITFIIGPSGTGKSVFIKQIIGLIKPDTGSILFDGQDICAMDDSELLGVRRRVGLLFQNAALFDSMNVFDNVAFPLREHTEKTEAEIARIVHDKLRQVGLKNIDMAYPSELSGGMKKRVGLARAIALDPEVMLYDEPTTGLDPIMTDVVDSLIVSMQRTLNSTSVVISHDIKTTLEVADNIIMIYAGEVVARGTPKEFQASENPIVRQFFSGSWEGPISVY